MKARTRQDKAAAPAATRKLKLSRETLKDLTPSGKQRDVKGGITQTCTGRGRSFSAVSGGGMLGGG